MLLCYRKKVSILINTKQSKEKILIAKMRRIGFVHLQGVEKYLEKHTTKKCYLITPVKPHENVLIHAEEIQSLQIIVSSDFQEEKKKIENEYSDVEIITVDPYQLAGRDGMLDGA